MRLIVTTVCLVAALVSACGGESCDDVADDGLVLLEDFFAEIDTLDVADSTTDAELIAEFEERADEIDRRFSDAGCTGDEIDRLMAERFEELSAESEFGQILLELVLSGGLFGNE